MNVKPITLLRDSASLIEETKSQEPVILTKNGEQALVVLSPDKYESLIGERPASKRIYGKVDVEQSNPLGFVRIRSVSIEVEVAGVEHNVKEIIKEMERAVSDKVSILVLPELCISSYTAGDLFGDSKLLSSSLDGLKKIVEASKQYPRLLTVVGLPLAVSSRLYNVAALIYEGEILGIVPKKHIPNYKEFYEARYFVPAPDEARDIVLFGKSVPFENKIIFVDASYPILKIGVEICEDLWVVDPPSNYLAKEGANLILNLSASNETVGKRGYRESLVSSASARQVSGYVYCSSGRGESSTDLVFGGQCLIYENGNRLSGSEPFSGYEATADIDLEKLDSERRKMNTFPETGEDATLVYFNLPLEAPEKIWRHYERNPFVPGGKLDIERVKLILRMQAEGLAQRMKAIHSKKAVVGLSGGLDSTLALLVGVEAFKLLDLPLENLEAITLPAFGTSQRTRRNAESLAKDLGVTFKEINIKETLLSHYKDIGHDPENHNIAYENAQARERTQVLLDYSNDIGGLMIGTGDLSELCLGWTTYSGDHMSSYGVNASIPKTLVRYLCEGYAVLHPECKETLLDIIDTPISPELLPTDKKGNIAQKTEDKIGPYELHDFFIYHYLRFLYSPTKLFRIATEAYEGKYPPAEIKKWLREFFKRFFQNQFKRSCLPDGAKVGSVAISPRGDWRMPSDASAEAYLKEIDELDV